MWVVVTDKPNAAMPYAVTDGDKLATYATEKSVRRFKSKKAAEALAKKLNAGGVACPCCGFERK